MTHVEAVVACIPGKVLQSRVNALYVQASPRRSTPVHVADAEYSKPAPERDYFLALESARMTSRTDRREKYNQHSEENIVDGLGEWARAKR